MSEVNISLYELLDLSIGTPNTGTVDFGALHALLLAVLKQLDVREMKTRWRDTPPGEGHHDHPVRVTVPQQDQHSDEGVIQGNEGNSKPGSELRGPGSNKLPTPSSGSPAESQDMLRSGIQTCQEDLSKAMMLIQDLHHQRDSLTEEMKELRLQQKMVDARAETIAGVEKCFHRMDALEENVQSLRDSVQMYPEELRECVTWDLLQSALLSDRGSPREDFINPGLAGPATYTLLKRDTSTVHNTPSDSSTPSSPHPVQETGRPEAPHSQLISGEEAMDTQTHPKPERTAAGALPYKKAGASEFYPQTVEALRSIGKLREKFSQLEAHVAALDEGKVEQSELTDLRELIRNTGSQEPSSLLMDQLNRQQDLVQGLVNEQEKKEELVSDVKKTMLRLQARCETLHESDRCLQEDSRQTQSQIQKLYRLMEELEEKKADKQMFESETKADKSPLENTVSRLQFDSVTEQLSAMFHELLNKVTGQEQDLHKVMDRLSTEMECKLNRIELDSVKKQLEGRWKNIHQKLQAQGDPDQEDAAAFRKQLVDRFHCLSCDRPVVKYIPGPHVVTLPSTPGFPAHKSIRPFTVYALEQFRQHYRSQRVSEARDYGHITMTRSCGGSHTVTSPGQRRSGLQSMKHQTEVDALLQSAEVDIIGLDGRIYKGRLNTPNTRTTESKLPTISNKDDASKTKSKHRSDRPAASPEAGHGGLRPHSSSSNQCSRSASSSSGRDWPVSALGCTSQISFTAAVESSAEADQ